jgi:hypothetical protein
MASNSRDSPRRLRRSKIADLPDETRELLGFIEQIDRRVVVFAVGKVLAAVAGAEQNAGVGAAGRLGYLHVKTIAVQGDFTRYAAAAGVETEIILAAGKAEGVRKAS